MRSPDHDQAMGHQAMLTIRVKSVALLFEPLDTSGSKAGTQFAHTCVGNEDLEYVGGGATDQKSQCHQFHTSALKALIAIG